MTSTIVTIQRNILVNCPLLVAGWVLVRDNQLLVAKEYFSDMKQTSISLLKLIPGR